MGVRSMMWLFEPQSAPHHVFTRTREALQTTSSCEVLTEAGCEVHASGRREQA